MDVMTAIRTEVQSDPMGRGYAGKTAAEIADLLNTPFSEPGPSIPQRAEISPAGFVGRFTPEEAAAIEAARPSNALLDWFMRRLELAQGMLDLTDPDLLGGMQMLAGVGLLQPGRVAQITAAPADLPGPDVEHPARIATILRGIAGAPNAVTATDVEAALA